MLHVTGDAVREEMVERCRNAYIRVRRDYELQLNGRSDYRPGPHWDGGEDARGYQHKSVWEKIATFMLRHDLDPERCVRLRFAHRQYHQNPVLPNQIAVDKYLTLYQQGDAERVASLAYEFTTENSICRCQLVLRDEPVLATRLRAVLADETVPLSPLFRHCLAQAEGLKLVAAYYFRPALQQYLTAMDEYDRVWGVWLYQEFKETARAAHQSATRRSK